MHEIKEKIEESWSSSLRSSTLLSNVIISDDTFRQALHSIAPNILTLNEQDAERELALMTRDKRYYDHMNRRSEQTLNQSIRYVTIVLVLILIS